MKHRNAIVGGASLTVACLAIGGGALTSSSAMATTTDPGKASVTMIRVGTDGQEPISCTLDNVDLPTAAAPGPMGTTGPAGAPATRVDGGSVVGSGTVTLSAGGSSVGSVGDPGPEIPPGLRALSVDDVQPGSDDECAAMRAEFDALP